MVDIALITTNWSEDRFNLLKATVNSIDRFTVKNKVMSIDLLEQGKVSLSEFDIFKEKGWKVISDIGGLGSGMILNQIRALKNCESDWVLAVEDDVLIHGIPDIELLEKHKIDWLCYNCHINENIKIHEEYTSNPNSYIIEGNSVFLVKPPELCDKWLLTFPASITKRNLLLDLHDIAFKKASSNSIEEGLSVAWKEINKQNVALYLNKIVLENISNITNLHQYAMMSYWNNDESLRHESVNNKTSMWY